MGNQAQLNADLLQTFKNPLSLQFERAKELLGSGADPCSSDELGWTAMHRAAHLGLYDACELLAAHGADVDAVNDSGKSVLDIAVDAYHPRVCMTLIALGATRFNPQHQTGELAMFLRMNALRASVELGNPELVCRALKQGFDPMEQHGTAPSALDSAKRHIQKRQLRFTNSQPQSVLQVILSHQARRTAELALTANGNLALPSRVRS